jgi:hypothetical protein
MRLEASRRLGSVAALLVAGMGCGPTIEAGLANAPSSRRGSPPRKQHDVIGNGPESCGQGQPGEQYREPPCAKQEDSDAGIPSLKAPGSAAPGADSTNPRP